MNVQKKLGVAMCIMGAAALMSGCGSDATPTGASGKLTQGPVAGAVVFADNVSGGVRFSLDNGEVATSTDADGNFVLPSQPAYNYILVSKGGTDKLTNKPAMEMIAPSGSANISPLTTLVALDTTGLVQAKIEALGTKFDADLSINATPAALNLAKSIETVIAALSETITTSAGSAAISSAQVSAVQTQAMQSIASSLSTTAQDLSKPSALNVAMTSAVTQAVTNINTRNTNISIPVGQSATIATNAVTASTTAVLGASAVGSSTSASISTVVVESTVINSSTSATLAAAVTSTATTVSSTATVTTTPAGYTPPVIPVITPTHSATGSNGSTVF